MKILIPFICLFICFGGIASAQDKLGVTYVDAAQFKLLGKSIVSDSLKFYRISEDLAAKLPKRVKELSKNTAGFNLIFKTNSTSIHIKWRLSEYKILPNMTPIAVDGFDLYGWNKGKWQFVAAARPSGLENMSTFIENLNGEMRHFKIYFPLYTGVEKVELGVDEKSSILPAADAFLPAKKIVVYGSSITQGASASRPGMAFTSVLGRKLNADITNLGFSGAGKIEIEVAEVISKIKADLFVLDCVPNPSAEEIRTRTIPFVERLRKTNPNVPILMVESLFRENGYWDQKMGETVKKQNAAFNAAYKKLKSTGMINLYYLNNDDLIGTDHEATIDGTHFTDLGHVRMADKLYQSITTILSTKHNNQSNPR